MASLTTRTPLTTLADADLVHTVDVSDTTAGANGTSKKITASNVKTYMQGAIPAGNITSGTFADARVAQSNVTQHQAALSITESQISDLGATVVLDSDIGSTVQAFDADTAKTDVAQEYSAAQNFNGVALTFDATQDWDLNTSQVATLTLTGNTTFDAPTNMKDGGTYVIILKQDATGSRTAAWNAVFKWPGGTAPTLSTAANAVDIVTFVSDGTNMYGVSQLNFS